MTSKEEAELLFKQQPRSGGPRSIAEYEQRARAERTKIAKLRVLRLAREAALLVTDDYPCFIVPHHNERIAQLKLPVYAVDANGMVPLSALPKEEYAAYTIRPKINRLLPDLARTIVTPRVDVQKTALEIDCPETTVSAETSPPSWPNVTSITQ